MVLYGIVSSSLQDLGDLCPLIAQSSVMKKQNPFFLCTPTDLLDLGIQMVMPSLSALLSYPPWQMLCNLSPLLRTSSFYQMQDKSIFLFSPRAFHQTRVEHLLPSMKTLNVCSSRQRFSYFLPVFAAVFVYGICKHLVFLLCPVTLCSITLKVIGRLLILGGSSFVQMGIHHLLSKQ